MSTVVRLRTRLVNHNALTRIDDELGENGGSEIEGGCKVALFGLGTKGASRRAAMWERSVIMVVFGSCWRPW